MCCSEAELPSVSWISKNIEAMYLKAKEDVIQYFHSIKGKISISADGWSDRKLNHYFIKLKLIIGITIHYGSNEIKTNNKLIGLIPSVEQDGVTMEKCLVQLLSDIGLTNKFFCLITDSGIYSTKYRSW